MLKKWLCMTVNTDKSYFWGWALVCVLRSTRELEKLSQGLTMKDLIVTPSQPDKHWPIYSEPTLLSNGSSAFLVSSHLLSPLSPLFPTSLPLLILTWFVNSFLYNCSIFNLNPCTIFTLVFILSDTFLVLFIVLLAYCVCVCNGSNQ